MHKFRVTLKYTSGQLVVVHVESSMFMSTFDLAKLKAELAYGYKPSNVSSVTIEKV